MINYVYSLSNADYVSLKQNLLVLETQQNICSNLYDTEKVRLSTPLQDDQQDKLPLNEGLFMELINVLMDRTPKHKVLIFDAQGVSFKLMKNFERFQILISEKYEGIVLIADRDFAECFRTRLHPSVEKTLLNDGIELICLLYSRSTAHMQVFGALPFSNLVAYISQELRQLVFSHLKVKELEPKAIPSSNIYANRYFNVRKLFCDSNLYQLSIFLMVQYLEKNKIQYDAFVCSSINGACIASSLSVYFRKPVVFLRNVGPQMNTYDNLLTRRIMEGHRYIYVFDFMCLGTEYQRIKMLCNIRSARIVLGLGVSKHKMPNEKLLSRGSKQVVIFTLFDINEFEHDYYKCFVDEKECETYFNRLQKE